MEKQENLGKVFDEISKTFMQAMRELELDQEAYWNNLSKEDQLKCFCAVVRRIHQGEIKDKGTYRWVLYDVFEFGPESYAQAQLAGYLDIHNSIYDNDHERNTLTAFARELGFQNPEEKVNAFYRIHHT